MKKITILGLVLVVGLASIAFSSAANLVSNCPCKALKVTVTGKVSAPTEKLAVGCQVKFIDSKGNVHGTAYTKSDGSYTINSWLPRKNCGANCCFVAGTFQVKVIQHGLKGSYPYVDISVFDACTQSLGVEVPTIELGFK
jgi:hypothetical protein